MVSSLPWAFAFLISAIAWLALSCEFLNCVSGLYVGSYSAKGCAMRECVARAVP